MNLRYWLKNLHKIPAEVLRRCYSVCLARRFNAKRMSIRFPLNYIRGARYFNIGPDVKFGRWAVITAWDTYMKQRFTPEVTIGGGCNFGDYLHLSCINRLSIGNNVLTGRWVTINDNAHGTVDYDSMQIPPVERPLHSKGPIVIGDNVWIGDKATILGGVNIGEGSVIGANSVVTRSIPPFSVAAGAPAVVIKTLSTSK